MKKLIFLFFILAIFASTNQTFAQAIHDSDPQPILCPGTAANPIAGVPYDYSALIDPALGSAYWYATTATTYLTGGVRPPGIEELIAPAGTIVAVATNYMDNNPDDASPTTTNITWTSDGLAAHTPPTVNDPPTLFVVLQYTAPASGCANNLKVYPIRPINAFVVDLMNETPGATQTPAGYGVTVAQCFDNVQSAVWQAAPIPNGSIVYDFGTNLLYYEVIAANFTASYTPTFRITNLQGNQTVDIDWGYTLGTYTTNVATGVGNGDYVSPVVTTNLTNTSTGVSIYVRVTVHNANWEGLAQLPITLAVEAINSASQHDVDNVTCLYTAPGFEDNTIQNLDRRPTLREVAPNSFLPVAP